MLRVGTAGGDPFGNVKGLTQDMLGNLKKKKEGARLTALVRSQQTDDADDSASEAPSATAYKTHSSGIRDVLEDLKKKDESHLMTFAWQSPKREHNFQMS